MTTLEKNQITGVGLITGLQSQVTINPLSKGEGVVFILNGKRIACDPQKTSSTDRGVVLMDGDQPLMLIEHFLAACGMLGYLHWQLEIIGAPELPILDGSAQNWVEILQPLLPKSIDSKTYTLNQSIHIHPENNTQTSILAVPNTTGFEVTCLLDFAHPDLKNKWLHFGPQTNWLQEIAPARTFGFLSELPELQARGLAKGVSLENTLGLTGEGGYTTPLRMPDECVRHKVLDFIGDMALWGIDVLRLNASFMLRCSGHSSHYQFGKELITAIE